MHALKRRVWQVHFLPTIHQPPQEAEILVIEIGMLEVNKPVLADDPYRLLQYERGIFEVVSPRGRRVRVSCPLERRQTSFSELKTQREGLVAH